MHSFFLDVDFDFEKSAHQEMQRERGQVVIELSTETPRGHTSDQSQPDAVLGQETKVIKGNPKYRVMQWKQCVLF